MIEMNKKLFLRNCKIFFLKNIIFLFILKIKNVKIFIKIRETNAEKRSHYSPLN